MTLPDERYRAVRQTTEFLQRLAGGSYSRVPKAVRAEAMSLLRHYPTKWDLDRLAAAAPDVVQEHIEDLHKFVMRGLDDHTTRTGS